MDSATLPVAAVAVAALVWGFAAWRRSVAARSAMIYRGLRDLTFDEVPHYLYAELTRVRPSRESATLERVAARMAGSGDRRAVAAEAVRWTAKVVSHLEGAGSRPDTPVQHAIAGAFENRALALETMAEELEVSGMKGAGTSRAIARQDRLFAAVLRAESVGHLVPLRAQMEELERIGSVRGLGDYRSRELYLEDLRSVLGVVEQLNRLPTPEDRALFLSQALAQVLEAQEQLRRRGRGFGTRAGPVVLEAVRQLLAAAIRDLHQRAELAIELRSREITARHEAAVVVEIRNDGQGHAHNVEVALEPDDRRFRTLQPRQTVKSLLRHEAARLEFAIEPRVSDRVRLSFRVTYDDQERRDRHLEFADVVRFRQPETRPFRPLLPNPYVVGRPLAESDVFIGREKTFDRIASSLEGVHQDNVVILIGQRRMGKTSILRRLGAHLDPRYLPVLVDLQGILGSGEAAFFRELAAAIADELEEAGVTVEGPAAAEFETDPGTVFRRRFLRGVCRELGERKLLVVFDEFEVLEERISAGELMPRILPYFRSLMQHEKQVSFMFAGTHRLDELTGDYWGVLFNMAIYLDVGHFSPEQVEELFTRPVEGAFEIDPLAIEKIYKVTGGHPHFSQLYARELVELRNRRQLSYITVQDVNQVTEIVADKGQLHISYLWDGAGRSERFLLLALEELIAREGLASLAAAHQYLEEHHIDAGDLPAAARALVRQEILDETGGQLAFRMDLLRQWLDRRHGLESFTLSERERKPT